MKVWMEEGGGKLSKAKKTNVKKPSEGHKTHWHSSVKRGASIMPSLILFLLYV